MSSDITPPKDEPPLSSAEQPKSSDEEASDRKASSTSKREREDSSSDDDKPTRSVRPRLLPDGNVDPSSDTDDESDHKLPTESKRSPAKAEGAMAELSTNEEDQKLEAKRAYNRANAARARRRVKEQLADLCQKVEKVSNENDKIKQKNEELEQLVLTLSEENQMLRRVLMEQQRMPTATGMGVSSRAEENEAVRRLLIERGGPSANSASLARLQASTPHFAASAVPPQLSSIVGGLPPSLQQSLYQLPTQGDPQANLASQQLYSSMNQGDSLPSWMRLNFPPPNPDGKK